MNFRKTALLAIIAACLGFLFVSYQPKVRFAYPLTEHFPRIEEEYHCYRDLIYGHSEPRDVLIFGASRTMFAINHQLVEDAYKAVTDHDTSAAVFTTTWANADLAYFFFRDYLRHNPAPKTALVELNNILRLEGPVRFVNPLYPYLAPPDAYLDELQPWEFVRSRLYSLSFFLGLHIRHIDLNLTNLLVAKRRFLVPSGDNCSAAEAAIAGHQTQQASGQRFDAAETFETLMSREAEQLLPPGGWEMVGNYDLLTERYAEDQRVSARLKAFGPDWSLKKPPRAWYHGPVKSRGLEYYRRMLELGRVHGVDVRFFVLPPVYQPETAPKQKVSLERLLGAPIERLPFHYTLLSYHHYLDLTHVRPEAMGLMSSWAASLIDREDDD